MIASGLWLHASWTVRIQQIEISLVHNDIPASSSIFDRDSCVPYVRGLVGIGSALRGFWSEMAFRSPDVNLPDSCPSSTSASCVVFRG